MFINIGGNNVVKSNEIIAILDSQAMNLPQSPSLKGMQTANPHPPDMDSFKSIVVTAAKSFYSPHSTATLLKRIK